MLHIRSKAYRLLSVLLAAVLLLVLPGCGQQEETVIDLAKQEHDFDLTPCTKDNGEAFTIAFMDLGPPIESSYLCLKGFAEGLQRSGYIAESVDLANAPEEFFAYYKVLTANDLGGYVKFCPEPYMIDEEGNEEIAEELRRKCADGEIDVIVATGTAPGVFLKELDLPVPFLVCLATDPVDAGIIDSAENTGDPDIWALVEEIPYKRQFEGYHRMLDFDKIVMVTVNGMDTITGNPLYREAAKELGVEVVEINFEYDDPEKEEYTQMVIDRLKKVDYAGVDAALFAFGAVDDDNAGVFAGMMARRGVPSLVGDGDSICEHGVMMCLSCFDYEGYGNYASMVLSNVFHGKNAGDQPCKYTSSPYILLNMKTAEMTRYDCSFDFLQSVDKVFR